MARYEFKLPDIGEGIAEAEIVAWHVKVGERVEEDQQIADMMTDKATVEMESPVAGKVLELAGEVGDQVPIGSVLAVIETEGAAPVEEAPSPESEKETPLADGASEPSPRRTASRMVWRRSLRRARTSSSARPESSTSSARTTRQTGAFSASARSTISAMLLNMPLYPPRSNWNRRP